jgi:hypothetical protein
VICPKYADARARFAVPAAPIADDGFPLWPGPRVLATGAFDNTGATGLLRANGFATTWTVTTAGDTVWGPLVVGAIGPLIAGAVPGGDHLFPITITCNGGASDGSPGADAYSWYLSQRSDGTRLPLLDGSLSPTGQPQYFTLRHPTDRLHSGTVILDVVGATATTLFPGSGGVAPTDADSLAKLFRDVALYVSRNSDQAYQWARLVAP